MNYTETPICGEPMREVPMKETLDEIGKKLTETNICLTAIIECMTGALKPDKEAGVPEARCMKDQLIMINCLSDDAVGMAHRIKELMF